MTYFEELNKVQTDNYSEEEEENEEYSFNNENGQDMNSQCYTSIKNSKGKKRY